MEPRKELPVIESLNIQWLEGQCRPLTIPMNSNFSFVLQDFTHILSFLLILKNNNMRVDLM